MGTSRQALPSLQSTLLMDVCIEGTETGPSRAGVADDVGLE